MTIRMARPSTRNGTANSQFRMRVPADLVAVARGKVALIELPAIGSKAASSSAVVVSDFIKFSLRTADRDETKVRYAAAATQVNAFFQSLRQGPAGLNHRQIIALSGEIYRLFTERFMEEPGSPEEWAAFKAFNRAALEGRITTAPVLLPNGATVASGQATGQFGHDLTAGINALPVSQNLRALEERFRFLTSWVLARHQIVTDETSRVALLKAVAEAAQDAGWALKRAAAGDYTPDAKALRFPPLASARKAVSLEDLFERWERETKPSGSTLTTWRGVMRNFRRQIGERAGDIQLITPDDVISFKDGELARGLTAKTVRESYIAGLKTVFAFGVSNRLLPTNPATGVRVAGRAQAGTAMLAYSDEEVARLLQLARCESLAYRRWFPILAASTGARIGELAQLSGSRVTTESGIPVLKIAAAEDGGSIKNAGSERTIPLHPALISEGFLEFARSKGASPLFYGRSTARSTGRHTSKGAANHFGAWVREQEGFQDPRKAPAHAFRHWFKTTAHRVGIQDSVADALQGHAAQTVAGRYRHFDLKTLAEAIRKLPLPGSETHD